MSDKRQLLNEFESCLNDFWGENPTRTERERLYNIAGL